MKFNLFSQLYFRNASKTSAVWLFRGSVIAEGNSLKGIIPQNIDAIKDLPIMCIVGNMAVPVYVSVLGEYIYIFIFIFIYSILDC